MAETNNVLKATEEKNTYPAGSAGRLIISNVPVVSPDFSIKQTEEYLLENVKQFETINYIYVAYKNGKLAGVISIKDTLRHPQRALIGEVMIKDLVVAHPYTDQERVVYLALKKNIKAVPVINKEGIFLGIVPSDVILEIAYDEAGEDLLGLAGVTGFKLDKKLDNTMDLSLTTLLKHRLPWLFIGMLGGLLTAQIVGLFERTLAENLILASFIPLIVYMGGATLAQTQAFFIRDLALSPKLNFAKYFFKQLAITLFIALFISISLFIFGLLFFNNPAIIQVLAVALFAAIFSSIISGLIIPFVFNSLKMDPANASGPIATIIQDLMGVTLYFVIATLFL